MNDGHIMCPTLYPNTTRTPGYNQSVGEVFGFSQFFFCYLANNMNSPPNHRQSHVGGCAEDNAHKAGAP